MATQQDILRFYPLPLAGRRAIFGGTALVTILATMVASNLLAEPVPGFVAPVTQAPVAEYVDDTRGLYIPPHAQLRGKTADELAMWQQPQVGAMGNANANLNRLATGVNDPAAELNRIGRDDGLLAAASNGSLNGMQLAQGFPSQPGMPKAGGIYAQPRRAAPQDLSQMPSLATGGQAQVSAQMAQQTAANPNMGIAAPQGPMGLGGSEIAMGGVAAQALDLQNAVVRLREERITVRRALQRMLDQVGGAGWTAVWDLDQVNATLPEMEISLYTEEPFMNVLNALLARLQSRSGQPLRVIKYDQTQRLVITDRATASGGSGVGPGAETPGGAAITETVLKEGRVSLHYDEVPLVDALENMVNQAGKGQWRLRMYAGTDQVLKPAHIEEPFGVALERVLKVFNLRYEIFPGGKLVVVTAGDAFGFRGVQ